VPRLVTAEPIEGPGQGRVRNELASVPLLFGIEAETGLLRMRLIQIQVRNDTIGLGAPRSQSRLQNCHEGHKKTESLFDAPALECVVNSDLVNLTDGANNALPPNSPRQLHHYAKRRPDRLHARDLTCDTDAHPRLFPWWKVCGAVGRAVTAAPDTTAGATRRPDPGTWNDRPSLIVEPMLSA
jgi:hypothetical protein